MPSMEYYLPYAADATEFTGKRSLRERRHQIVTEGARDLGFFLATIDEDVSPTSNEEMKASQVQLVVLGRVRDLVPHYSAAVNVLSFEDILEDHLDPKMKRWKKHGILG